MIRAGLALVLVPVIAAAGEFPTTPDEMDKFCEAIGETPNVAVSPRERMWFKDHCVCRTAVGCGAPGTARFIARSESAAAHLRAQAEAAREQSKRRAAKARDDAARAQRAAAEEPRRVERARAATAALRQAFWACSATRDVELRARQDRAAGLAAKKAACFEEGRRFFDACYASRAGDERRACEVETKKQRDACLADAAYASSTEPLTDCTAAAAALDAACAAHRLENLDDSSDCYRRGVAP